MKWLDNTLHRLLLPCNARPRVDKRNRRDPIDKNVRKAGTDHNPAAAKSRHLNQKHRQLLNGSTIIDFWSELSKSISGGEIAIIVERGGRGGFNELSSGAAAMKLKTASTDPVEAASKRVVRDEHLGEGVSQGLDDGGGGDSGGSVDIDGGGVSPWLDLVALGEGEGGNGSRVGGEDGGGRMNG